MVDHSESLKARCVPNTVIRTDPESQVPVKVNDKMRMRVVERTVDCGGIPWLSIEVCIATPKGKGNPLLAELVKTAQGIHRKNSSLFNETDGYREELDTIKVR